MKQYREKYKFRDKLNVKEDYPKIKKIPKNLEKNWDKGKNYFVEDFTTKLMKL